MQIQEAMENTSLIDAAMERELSSLYRAEGRHYHGIAHVEALLALARQHCAALADPEAIEAAIWFHDAIYDSRRSDNETQSAALATRMLEGRSGEQRIGRIAAMIEATATHELPGFTDEAARRDAALFLDMDLSILGAEPDEFDAYERAVRLEYEWVPEPAWRSGRAAVLRKFLSRDAIFRSEQFQPLETRARHNIERSLTALERPVEG
jgi:predicted metal-dependent HD superfamily phosphohydrolase